MSRFRFFSFLGIHRVICGEQRGRYCVCVCVCVCMCVCCLHWAGRQAGKTQQNISRRMASHSACFDTHSLKHSITHTTHSVTYWHLVCDVYIQVVMCIFLFIWFYTAVILQNAVRLVIIQFVAGRCSPKCTQRKTLRPKFNVWNSLVIFLWSRGIALSFLRPWHWRWGGGISNTPLPLYPRERPGTHCMGDWVGPRAGLDGCGKSRPTGIRSPDLYACSESLYRLSYRGRHI